MRVRVVNELDAAKLERQTEDARAVQPYRTVLIPDAESDWAGYGPLTLPSNPPEVSGGGASTWEPRRAVGASPELSPHDFVDGGAETIAFQLLLQPQSPDRNDEIVKILRAWTFVPSPVTGRPPILRVQRGTGQHTKTFRGHLSRFNYTERRTDKLGRAIVLELDLEFTRNAADLL